MDKKKKKISTGTDDELLNDLDGGMPMDEPGSGRGSRGPRGPVLVWSESKDRALAYVVRNPDSEDGDTIDEITARLAKDEAFSADVDSGALTPAKVQLRRQQLIKRGLVAPELRRRAFTRYTPKVDELNSL